MPGVAIMEMSVREVQDADKECDEHVLVVLLSERVVDLGRDQMRVLFVRRDATEEGPDRRHDKRSRNTFSADIADAEEEFVVADIEIIQIAADLLRRIDHAIDIQIQAVGKRRKDLRQHRALDRLSDLQFVHHSLLLVVRGDQILDITPAMIHDKNQQREA